MSAGFLIYAQQCRLAIEYAVANGTSIDFILQNPFAYFQPLPDEETVKLFVDAQLFWHPIPAEFAEYDEEVPFIKAIRLLMNELILETIGEALDEMLGTDDDER